MSYFYMALTLLFTVYGQIIIKWQAELAAPLPTGFVDKFVFLLRLSFNPWVLSSLFAAFLAALAWMAAMTRLPLSHAYPIVSLSFVLVLLSSYIFFTNRSPGPK